MEGRYLVKYPEKKSTIIIIGMLIVWGVFVWLGLALRPEKANPVAGILAQFEAAQKALQNEDLITLKKLSSLDGIAGSVATDIVDIPDANTAMGEAITNNVAAALLAEFETLLKDQGGMAPNPTSVLGQVYVSLVGVDASKMHLKSVSVTEVVGDTALLTMFWHREDVDVTFPLMMNMAVQNDLWTFMDVDGLEEAFVKISARQSVLKAERAAKVKEILNSSLLLDRAKISTAIATDETSAPKVMLFMAVKNASQKDIKTYHAKVSVVDEDGTVLKIFDLSDTDGQASGSLSEKSWPIFVDVDDVLEKQVLIKPAEELSVNLNVSEIVYVDGEVLALTAQPQGE